MEKSCGNATKYCDNRRKNIFFNVSKQRNNSKDDWKDNPDHSPHFMKAGRKVKWLIHVTELILKLRLLLLDQHCSNKGKQLKGNHQSLKIWILKLRIICNAHISRIPKKKNPSNTKHHWRINTSPKLKNQWLFPYL